jgi:hypothetical protein
LAIGPVTIMLPAAQFVIEDEAKWNKILERHRIKKNMWQNMIMEYENFVPDFNPNLIRYVDDLQFIESTGIFHFEKVTIKGMKSELIKWLKQYWLIFFETGFMKICNKIILKMQEYNQEFPEYECPYVNFIPLYGGHTREPENFPGEDETNFMKQNQFPYLLAPQIPKDGKTYKGCIQPEENGDT